MSAFEEAAKPVLVRAFGRDAIEIKIDSASALARWVVLKTIVGEHASIEHLTPTEDRYALRKSATLPAYFRVFVARHNSQTQAAYVRHSTTVSRSRSGPVPSLPSGMTRNIQLVSLLVGSLYFHVTAVRASGISMGLLDPVHSMQRIHPLDPLDKTPVLPLVGEAEMHTNSQAMERLIHHPRVLWGGDLPG